MLGTLRKKKNKKKTVSIVIFIFYFYLLFLHRAVFLASSCPVCSKSMFKSRQKHDRVFLFLFFFLHKSSDVINKAIDQPNVARRRKHLHIFDVFMPTCVFGSFPR